MLGLISKSKHEETVAAMQHTIDALRDQIKRLEKQIPHKKRYKGLTSGFHGPVKITVGKSLKSA